MTEIKFGLTYVTYVYKPERTQMVRDTLTSLARTSLEGLGTPLLRLSYRPSGFPYHEYYDALKEKFDVYLVPDSPQCHSMTYAVEDAGLKILDEHPEVTHVVHLVDDRIYHPNWLIELRALIERHPEAKAWNVFRSAYTDYHKIIGGDGKDVLMTMHDSIGCTTGEEWKSFIREFGYVGAPDIDHARLRPGERWATSKDYMDIHQTGRHYDRGIGEVDRAIDFVGEE